MQVFMCAFTTYCCVVTKKAHMGDPVLIDQKDLDLEVDEGLGRKGCHTL